MADKTIALMLYGNGAELGNFKLFADDAAAELVRSKKFDKSAIEIKQTLSRAAFFAALSAVPSGTKIKELHVFSHSIGGGLYVGYHDATANANRLAAWQLSVTNNTKITYAQVLAAETGGILTDHLLFNPIASDRAALKGKFTSDAFIKIWGCNSGVSGWVYSDTDSATNTSVTDPNANTKPYYWRALNTQNTPKPSIAQAFATFFGVKVFGAGSGSHIEVLHNGKWISSSQYKKVTGRFAGEPETLRLHPDSGDYNPFKPAP